MNPLDQTNQITQAVIGAAIEVHRALGPGLLESAYSECLAREFSLREIPFQRELQVPISYKGVHLDCGYRLDFLIADLVILEVKAVQEIEPVHNAQLLSYLKLTSKRVGLLINFHVPVLKDGIIRKIL